MINEQEQKLSDSNNEITTQNATQSESGDERFQNEQADNERSQKEQRVCALSKRKVGLDRNASLCAIVLAMLCYNTYSAFNNDDPAIWFYIVMGLLIIACIAVAAYDLINSRKCKAELETLRSELEAEDADNKKDENSSEDTGNEIDESSSDDNEADNTVESVDALETDSTSEIENTPETGDTK